MSILKTVRMIEIKKSATAEFCFVLKAESGHALFNSVIYSNKKTAEAAVNSLNDLKGNTFERKTNTNGKFLFSLKNNNGNVIGNSQLYQSEAGMENGIKNLTNRISSISDLK